MCLMNFDEYIHLCNYHPSQDREHFYHSKKLPHILCKKSEFPSSPRQQLLCFLSL